MSSLTRAFSINSNNQQVHFPSNSAIKTSRPPMESLDEFVQVVTTNMNPKLHTKNLNRVDYDARNHGPARIAAHLRHKKSHSHTSSVRAPAFGKSFQIYHRSVAIRRHRASSAKERRATFLAIYSFLCVILSMRSCWFFGLVFSSLVLLCCGSSSTTIQYW